MLWRRSTEGDDMNMTPLIDVVFNLLVFFLVATSFQRIQRELQVALPRAKASEVVSMDIQPVAVTISRSGEISMGGTRSWHFISSFLSCS